MAELADGWRFVRSNDLVGADAPEFNDRGWEQVPAAEQAAVALRPWWVMGPYACYSAADFEANEAIENARNSDEHGNEWNRVMGLGGRELRPVVYVLQHIKLIMRSRVTNGGHFQAFRKAALHINFHSAPFPSGVQRG